MNLDGLKEDLMSLLPRPKNEDARAVSLFTGERLEILFIKDGRKEAVVLPESGPETAAEIARRWKGGTWVHVVARQSGFVKTFPAPAGKNSGDLLVRRVREEMPHLADEMIYHIALRETERPGAEALLFGISKAVLEDHLAKLGRVGIAADAIVLSTEVLLWFYQNDFSAKGLEESVLLVHDDEREMELLYLKSGNLLQSRWFKKQSQERSDAEALVHTANVSFQREWRTLPEKAVVLASGFAAGPSLADLPCEAVAPGGLEKGRSFLLETALKAHQAGAVFDFTPVAWEEKRMKGKTAREVSRAFAAAALLASAFFFASLARVGGLAAESAWVGLRRAPLAASVKDLNRLRVQAGAAENYSQKKNAPVLLIGGLSKAVREGLLLTRLEYDRKDSAFFVRGEAIGENYAQEFLAALRQDPAFERVSLERLEASTDEFGGHLYEFEIRGALRGPKS